ncbi:MAG: hypothetical protein K0V04_46435 [Deltaproteobacteria bacterium]|nr:hypothetical protein [Deltaproteobacteria bacterium]
METYLFVPRSLGLDRHSYPRDQFYADAQAYIRFKTPSVPLPALADPDNADSPLQRARRLIVAANGAGEIDPDRMRRELRLLGCLVRANLRDAAADIRAKVDRLDDPGEHRVLAEDVRQAIGRLLRDVSAILSSFRDLRPDFLQTKRPAWLRELFEYVDEYLSISAESYLTAVLSRLDAHAALRDALSDTRQAVTQTIVDEQGHRQGAGYVSVLDPDGENRHYIYRKGALKKFMSSVLFLEIHKEREGRGISNVVAGIAAAVAMLFSTIAAIWSQGAYGLNSFPFVLAIVISYVFKDRIKEWLRTYFSGLMSRWLYDYSVLIHDPVAGIVGRCRESFGYVTDSNLPTEIKRLRHCDSSSVLEAESKPEGVMKYVKDVTLRSRQIARAHGRLGDVNDIIRLNISSFLGRMDEPQQTVATYSEELDAVTAVTCPKAYHVNLVMVLKAEGKKAAIDRFRIIMDKQGIRDLQVVELSA